MRVLASLISKAQSPWPRTPLRRRRRRRRCHSPAAWPSSPARRAASAAPSPSTWPRSAPASSSATPPAPGQPRRSPPSSRPAVAVKADVSDEAGARSLSTPPRPRSAAAPRHPRGLRGPRRQHVPRLADTSAADFDAAFAVNARGAFLCLQEAANRLRRGARPDRGRVVDAGGYAAARVRGVRGVEGRR